MYNAATIWLMMIISTTGMKWLGGFSHRGIYSRINNTKWMMKWRWNGGVERKAKLLGECWTFFNLHFPAPFPYCFTSVHFSQHPLPKKCTSFFLLIINPKILFPLSSLPQFLFFLNKYANYSYLRIWNLPVNPVWRVPGFMEEKGR